MRITEWLTVTYFAEMDLDISQNNENEKIPRLQKCLLNGILVLISNLRENICYKNVNILRHILSNILSLNDITHTYYHN